MPEDVLKKLIEREIKNMAGVDTPGKTRSCRPSRFCMSHLLRRIKEKILLF
jgi:hypothetical protein